tara:strand:- start:939 stop:1967 length:1029 start_codon:yes stop_codon:yes gene_type:complete
MMTELKNLSITLKTRPTGIVDSENFSTKISEVKTLKENQVLIKVLYLSLDPYMRGRMSEAKSYADPLQIGEIITAESAGIVIESKSTKYSVGEYVCCRSGWQEYFISNDKDPMTYKVDPKLVPLSTYLGVCGMTGRTAYFGLMKEATPSKGETLVVSAASGAVGSIVGQIGKKIGLNVIGIAGSDEKCNYVEDELNFDACVNYKSASFRDELASKLESGVDIYFESVGGSVTETVTEFFNSGSRAPICGYISNYNAKDITKVKTPFHIFGAMKNPPKHKFFLVFDHYANFNEANEFLLNGVRSGELKYKEMIVDGLEKSPEYFKWLFTGNNFGKLIVKVANP